MTGQPVNMLHKGAPIPAALGRVADEYARIKALRLAMEKETEAVKERESELKGHLIDNLSKSAANGGDTGAAGLLYRAQVVVKRTYHATDWQALHAFIQKSGRFDFLQKRLADKAVKDYVEQEQVLLPGTEAINVPDVSVTKI